METGIPWPLLHDSTSLPLLQEQSGQASANFSLAKEEPWEQSVETQLGMSVCQAVGTKTHKSQHQSLFHAQGCPRM